MKNQISFCLVFFSLFCFNITFINASTLTDSLNRESIFDFISNNQVEEINIEANFDSILTHKKKIRTYLKGKISFASSLKENLTFPVKLKPRGKNRRLVCEVPPIKLKFEKGVLNDLGLNDKYKSLKLVTHCSNSDTEALENVLKEHLIYQIYNIHSQYSLRTHLIKINYIQSGEDSPLFSSYGILIENQKELADRFDSSIVDRLGLSFDTLKQNEANTHAMFQCMIGNSDWSLYFARNVKMLKLKSEPQLIIFPYDFDFSGFVDAAYAKPNPSYQLKSTKDRVFLGTIYSEKEMWETAEYFLTLKDATLEKCMGFEKLSKRERRSIVKYLNSFYEILEEKNLQEKLVEFHRK